MTQALHIWVGPIKAATLELIDNGFSLAYTQAWQQSPQAFAFSPHLPFGQPLQGAGVRHFFSNLLPEGKPLEALSQAYQVSQYDVFGILRKVGRDCAGALVLTDEDLAPEAQAIFNSDAYEEVSHAQLQDRITESRVQDVPLMFWRGKRRMSLPGVQNKMGIYMAQDGGLWLPKDGAPTSHILKVGDARYPDMVINEFVCMRLAQLLGFAVPNVQWLALPEPVLLVQRYDRQWTADGGLLRTHQIDGCQALNIAPEQKYEEPAYEAAPAGASFAQLLKLHPLCQVPAKAQTTLLQWLMLNFILGNTDAHAKNLSFIVSPRGLTVAPFYDLVNGSAYAYQDMAQCIGGESNLSVIGKTQWQQLAKECAIPMNLLKQLAKPLLARFGKVMDKLPVDVQLALQAAQSDLVRNMLPKMTARVGRLVEGLL